MCPCRTSRRNSGLRRLVTETKGTRQACGMGSVEGTASAYSDHGDGGMVMEMMGW